jgi:hypothetical protein
LEYSQKGNELKFKYSNTVQNLKLPVRIGDQTINPTAEWQTLKLKSSVPVEFNRNYYIMFKKV